MLVLVDEMPFDSESWPGKWVWASGCGGVFEVVQFSLCFSIDSIAEKLRFHVSADNRYKLYLDGQFLGLGPQRGDLCNWYFESYELDGMEKGSEHVLTAIVWYDRDNAPLAQISSRPAFFLAAEDPYSDILSTDLRWKCKRLTGNNVIGVPEEAYCAGMGFDTTGIRINDYCPSKKVLEQEFQTPILVGLGKKGRDYRAFHSELDWRLRPRTIPGLESNIETIGKCRRLEIDENNSQWKITCQDIDSFIASCDNMPAYPKEVLRIPANTHLKFLVDNITLTIGYPNLVSSYGKGAVVKLSYQEALQSCSSDILSKGNRDEIEGRSIVGISDNFRPDGSQEVLFEPLWFRCWRYIEIDIQTSDDPLEINLLCYRTTGYPLELKADIKADDSFNRLLEPGFRTMRLCAVETYFDCPYYEQLQYVGDTRIQALQTYLICDEDRLAREAIDAFDRSRIANGLTLCRCPSRAIGIIPSFSLFYIGMLNDFLMWRGDKDFVRKHILAVEAILHCFEGFITDNGLIGKMPGWSFVDWAESDGWQYNGPPGTNDGTGFLMSFLYLYALQQAVSMYGFLGDQSHSEEFREKSERLQVNLRERAFDSSKEMFLDEMSGKYLSQHTNILAILTNTYKGVIDGEKLLISILQKDTIAKTTCYFSFYLFEAMYYVGRGDLIWPALKPWHEMLDKGLTTFSETSDPTRSDCHAWSSHPLYHFFASVLGIRPLSPGCKDILINPISAKYSYVPDVIGGSFCIPQGNCKINMEAKAGTWKIKADFPSSVKLQGLSKYDTL